MIRAGLAIVVCKSMPQACADAIKRMVAGRAERGIARALASGVCALLSGLIGKR